MAKHQRCSNCGQTGHNGRTCQRPKVDLAKLDAAILTAYAILFEDYPDPPENDELKLQVWRQRIIALITNETIKGRGCPELNAQIIKLTAGLMTGMPKAALYEQEEKLKRRRLPTKPKPMAQPLSKPVGSGKPLR